MSLLKWINERFWESILIICIEGVLLITYIVLKATGILSWIAFGVGISIWAVQMLVVAGWLVCKMLNHLQKDLVHPFQSVAQYLKNAREAQYIQPALTTGIQEIDLCIAQVAELSSAWAEKNVQNQASRMNASVMAEFIARLGDCKTEEDIFERIKILCMNLFGEINGVLIFLKDGIILNRVDWGKTEGTISTNCSVLTPGGDPYHLSQSEVYQRDGCSNCSLTTPRQSACCYRITQSTGTTYLIHFGSHRQNYFSPEVISILNRAQEEISKQWKRVTNHREIELMAYTDGLTGLKNKTYLHEFFEGHGQEIDPILVVIGDIDHFKSINDTFGHPTGDSVLKQVGGLLSQYSEQNGGFVCRYGGEEFVWILPRLELALGVRFVEALRIAISEMEFKHEKQVTMSFGIAEYPLHASTVSGTLKRADDALYMAKKNRNKVVACVE